jgi:hypothetical protein
MAVSPCGQRLKKEMAYKAIRERKLGIIAIS